MMIRLLKRIWILCLFPVLIAPVWAQRGPGMQRFSERGLCTAAIDSIPKQSLDAQEAAGLAYMREEEKLVHDVYAKLQTKWGGRFFGNIVQSEQRHADSIRMLLTRYQMADTVTDSPVGVFQNEELQNLYHDLVQQGERSLIDALRAGAEIEDMDICELEKSIAAADNEDLKLVYRNLLNASQNHFRIFSRQLQKAGASYQVQYMSQAMAEDILAATKNPGTGKGVLGRGRRSNNGLCPRSQH